MGAGTGTEHVSFRYSLYVRVVGSALSVRVDGPDSPSIQVQAKAQVKKVKFRLLPECSRRK